jgi:hypothetical protein
MSALTQNAEESRVSDNRDPKQTRKKATAADRGTIGSGLFTRDRKFAGRV